MIQELFGGGSHTSAGELIVSEKNSSPHFTGVVSHAPPVSPSPSPKPSTTPTTNPKTSSENLTPLRCPRCDSSNTKFCYYNNYNLTQPRHFCKTCRRYWTKGGALRNVPIGGGCRKNNKINNIGHAIPSPLGKPSTAKFIRSHLLTSENNMGKTTTNFPNQFDHGLTANSLLWTSPQTSHLLALLRSNQTQNPNPNYNYSMMNYVKQEESSNPYNISNNFWRNNEESHQAELHQQSGGLMVQNVCNEDHHQMYNQKVSLKSADDEHNYYSDTYNNYVPGGLLMGNVHASSSPNCSEILESAPVNVGGRLVSCWNNNNNNNNTSLPRPHDLPTTNGAYH